MIMSDIKIKFLVLIEKSWLDIMGPQLMFYIKIKPKRKYSIMGIYTNLCSLYDFPVI